MEIVLTGSVAFDYIMTFPGYFRDHILPDHLDSLSLSFLVDSLVRQRGGVAPNIAYTLSLLGERSHLFATVGEDFEDYRLWLERRGIDTTFARVISGEFTASFFANIDRANAQIASFYPGAMAYAAQLSLKDITSFTPELVVISPNDPDAMNAYVAECQELDIPYIYDPSQQLVRLDPAEVLRGIQGALALFVNEYEFALIQKVTGLDPQQLLESECHSQALNGPFIVVTRGVQGVSIYTPGEQVHVPVVVPQRIVDPTGVGDALRGGFLTGFSHGLGWETCGQMGALAATYCLEQKGTQGQHYSPAEFVARFRRNFDDQGSLDFLLEIQGMREKG